MDSVKIKREQPTVLIYDIRKCLKKIFAVLMPKVSKISMPLNRIRNGMRFPNAFTTLANVLLTRNVHLERLSHFSKHHGSEPVYYIEHLKLLKICCLVQAKQTDFGVYNHMNGLKGHNLIVLSILSI